MCGITFIYSKKNTNVLEYIFNSLELIQNRGYDSMGICYLNVNENNIINNYNYEIIKKASTLKEDCFELLKKIFIEKNLKKNIFSKVALGHTRWATHGGKTDYNSHPHISQNGNIILVHNGIINNFIELKNFLISENYIFNSETDSEVIANLIEYYIINCKNSFEDALNKTINSLEGTWALIIIYTKIPDTYYITRKGSPLLLGYNDNYIMCCSETNGFIGLVNSYIPLNDNNIIKITNNNYYWLKNNSEICNLHKTIKNDIDNNKSIYNHWMIKEIMEQPLTIEQAHNHGARINDNIIKLGGLDRISKSINNVEYIYLIGCGTSYNAALIGELYLNETKKFINIKVINACDFNKNVLPNVINPLSILYIFLSQSGETIDVYNCLKICKKSNSLTMGIINKVDSLISREVDCGVYLNAGNEFSVASTKSFTSMLVVLSLISMWFRNNDIYNNKILNCLRILPNTINNLLYDTKFIEKIDIIKTYIVENNVNNIFLLGKDKLYPIACEGALKIKEVTYIHCEGFSAGSLKHGPFALLDKTNLTFLLIDYEDYENYANIKSCYYEIKGRNTNLFVLTNSYNVINDLNIENNNYILLYKLDYYNEIIFTIALQKIAYEISIAKNINPDKPRNLAKVVTVE